MNLSIPWECSACGADNSIPITEDMIEFTPAAIETRDCPGSPARAEIGIADVEIRRCGKCQHMQEVKTHKKELEHRVAGLIVAERRDRLEAEKETAWELKKEKADKL